MFRDGPWRSLWGRAPSMPQGIFFAKLESRRVADARLRAQVRVRVAADRDPKTAV